MRQIPLEDCIINIAKKLNVKEIEVVIALQNAFETEGGYTQEDLILDDLYWVFNNHLT